MDISTPPPLKSLPPLDALYSTTSGLFERLNQLAATAWDAEQDGRLHESDVEILHRQLGGIESRLNRTDAETDDVEEQEHALSEGMKTPTVNVSDWSTHDPHLESLCSTILTDLISTVSSLRLRHTEHRHLLHLSTSRLEAVAQRSLAQERAIQDLTTQLRNLRNENNILGKENEDSQVEIQNLKAENESKHVAMEAMAGAVSGLEGWVENTLPPSSLSALQHDTPRRGKRREVIRGRGRFRGRYYVDEHSPSGHEVDTEVRDLHDGVKAWLRGFRDVEEGLRARGGIARGRRSDLHGSLKDGVVEDEWGDFESAA